MTEQPDRPERPNRGRPSDRIDTTQVYVTTSDKITGIPEDTLLRVLVKTDNEYIVQFHVDGTRPDIEGQQVRGLIPRTVRVTPAMFDNNTQKTNREYQDE